MRFGMALRGYRMRRSTTCSTGSAELADRDARIAELEAGRAGAGDEPDASRPAPTAAQG